ncbi:APC family permease, partial [Streptomyces sp. NPDC085612]|uniref:APC family permease n=1 Tax=Streptomyces sp. NPDC085612 TaxID=3365732 RepID=UPI0037D82CF3
MRDGAGSVERSGYRQELRRTLGPFQVFAISFAFISVAVGIFGTYDQELLTAGPVGIWLWLIAAVGQTLVALVVAQFAARIPLSGSSYQWASRLGSPRIGWWFGWLTFCFLAIAVVAMDDALVAVVAVALVVAVLVAGDGEAANLTPRGVAAHEPGYFAIGGGLMAAMIMGLATLVGFDSAANLAEKAKDPHRSVPRAIVGSVVAAGVLGMLFLVALTVAIEDVPRISADGSPVAAILRDRLGPAAEKGLLLAVVFAFFGAGTVVMVSCSRLVYAMSRDARFPAHRVMRRVGAGGGRRAGGGGGGRGARRGGGG